MVRAISGLEASTRQVTAGKYTPAEVVHTGDELEGLAHSFNGMVEGLKERDRLKESFGRYVTRQVAERVLQGKVDLGGELVPVTVLFSDIRSFTTISESMDPHALLGFLNVYFSGMVDAVMGQQGVVDKFIGDALMAVFGAPVPHPDDPVRAVKAALAMRECLKGLNQRFTAQGLPEIRSGIGIHTGEVVAGNMGHVERMEYTVIGDAVNLASRLESATKELGADIVLSEATYLQVQHEVIAEPIQRVKVKGRSQEVMVYRLVGLKVESGKMSA
jgi:adenylate cyclase